MNCLSNLLFKNMEIKTNDLVLKPKIKAPTETIEKYKELLDVVCGRGDDKDTNQFYFQKEAVIELLNYFLNYRNLSELLEDNLFDNEVLRDYYKEQYGDNFKNNPLLDDLKKRIATIDLPTGSGKSYVIFLIAIILLNELPEIDRIQIITPSKTIRKQLGLKFEELFEKIKTIQNLRLPSIVSLHENALAENCLAIDNIHKLYETENASLAKEDSFGKGRGKNVLVINDEAHHIYNFNQGGNPRSEEYQDIKKWKEFLFNPEYEIENIINFTATPFEGKNVYLHNVIYRYGLMEAIKNRVVKDIKYLPEGDEKISEIEAEKQQLKLAIEKLSEIKADFKKADIKKKPIGIIITADINEAKKVKDDFEKILRDKGEKDIDEKVICYTSDPEHLKNEELFDNVDIYEGKKANKVEWIISVSMLSEGWDCKNVFLIVPHQEKAFNSKLLISQVVGRGLRRVANLDDKYQEVIVLNHKKWGDENINLLVNDVIDTTTRFEIKPTSEFNFEIDYLKEEHSNFEKDFAEIQKKRAERSIKKVSMKKVLDQAIASFKEQVKDIDIERKTKTLRDKEEGFLKANIEAEYQEKSSLVDWYNHGIGFDDDFKDKFRNAEEFITCIFESPIIKKSKIKDKISIYNFDVIKKEFSEIDWGMDTIEKKETDYSLAKKNTKDFGVANIGIKTFFDNYEVAFYSEDIFKIENWEYFDDIVGYQLKQYQRRGLIEDNDDLGIFKGKAKKDVLKKFKNIQKENYKNPLNIILPESEPEKKFIERLFENSEKVAGWIKSKSRGFYYIDCSKDEFKIEFNPDFIIKMNGNNYLLVETKDNGDIIQKNKLKLEGLSNYLEKLNKKLVGKKRYFGYIISPDNFDNFFTEIIRKCNYEYEPEFHKKLKKI